MDKTQYNSFVSKLQEIFMMDHAELDFGIYRIMNYKRDEINDFLTNKLLPQVETVLKQNLQTDSKEIEQKLEEKIAQYRADGMDDNSIERLNSIKELRKKLAETPSVDDLQSVVFSRLTQFFSRYYKDGDFISQRRYKSNGDSFYMLPYNGEEVKLAWANQDQYYIKTSEYFKNYVFVLPNSQRKVHFVLKDASTEQNNNKNQNGMERRFALWQGENEEAPLSVIDGELEIYFTYELMPKTSKQKDLITKAFNTLKPLLEGDDFKAWRELLMNAVKADRSVMDITWLQKHLQDYTAKNSFDYFIHKDLGGFLRRELDFFIKNEVLVIDDLTSAKMASQFAVIKAIEQVGNKIITFLAQLENFQKKLWLKKKFVVGCDYCITLDRIPESMYPKIVANDKQRMEWVRLFAIDEIKGDMMTEKYSEPLTVEFLKQNQFLVLDTKFFSLEFKHELLSSMDNIDSQCNGLLINSENFQGLQFLQEKYANAIRCIFVDPPYNTEDSEGENDFNYKDNFKHSSWLSLYNDRLKSSYTLLSTNGIHSATISDNEHFDMIGLYNSIFSENNRIANVEWNSTKSVTNTALISMGHTHIPFYAKNIQYYIKNRSEFRLQDSQEGFENPDNDPRGPWKADPFQVGGVRPNQLYTIINPNTGTEYKPNPGNSWKNEYTKYLELVKDNRIVFGKNGTAGPQRKRFWFEAEGRGRVAKTWWDDCGTTTNGTSELKNMFGSCPFKNPKPTELMKRIISLCTPTGQKEYVLDYFAGSGTTGQAVIDLNRENDHPEMRKYILIDMGAYFNDILLKRIEKSIYSIDWLNGKPVSRKGVSQCVKYIQLEQYEDTLNNLISSTSIQTESDEFNESYMLGYMLDIDTRGSMLNIDWFKRPFDVKIKTTKDNELVDTTVDMVETFNYLIGLNVETESWHHNGDICVIEGKKHINKENTLVIWRNCDTIDNDELNEFFRKQDFNTLDMEYDTIYVNGDNNLPNVRRDEDHWKVDLIERVFKKKMFENY